MQNGVHRTHQRKKTASSICESILSKLTFSVLLTKRSLVPRAIPVPFSLV